MSFSDRHGGRRPRILVTNDDGIVSEGLRTLEEALRETADVTVVAPDREQSAVSHALTIRHPLRATEIGRRRWAVDGTPTDCVNLAVLHLCRDQRPDLVVSGINFGLNLGDDVTYSGTVSAAFEASIRGIPSIAVSQELGPDLSFSTAARFARDLASTVLEADGPSPARILNVNVPAGEPRGIRVCRLGQRELESSVVEKIDPRGEKYFWIGQIAPGRPDPGTDFQALEQGFITVTPLHLDLTAYDQLSPVRDLLEPGHADVSLDEDARRRS